MTSETHPRNVIGYCPRCGSKDFKTTNEGQSFNCEECRFDYYINNSAAVACLIFNEKGELLLTRRAINPAKGMLDLPGGFVNQMERAEDAVIREIREELGVNITKSEYLVSFPNEYVYSGFSVFTVDLAFICTVDNIAELVPDDDVSAVEFKFPEKIQKEELCSESMFKIIKYYINIRK